MQKEIDPIILVIIMTSCPPNDSLDELLEGGKFTHFFLITEWITNATSNRFEMMPRNSYGLHRKIHYVVYC